MSKRLTKEYLEKVCEEKDFTFISDYTDKGTHYVDFVCNKHADKGVQTKTVSDLKKRKGCRYCGIESVANSKRKTPKEIMERISKFDIVVEKIEYPKSGNTLIWFVCNHHKEKGVQCHDFAQVDKIKSMCKYCSGNKRKTIEQFKEELYEVSPEIIILGDTYYNNKTKIKCKCSKCGHEWYASPDNLLNKLNGCPRCKMSKGEKVIHKALKDNGIDFIPQHRFEGCRDERELPFDFYIPSLNMCIEYQGTQHYFPTNFRDRSDEESAIAMHEKVKKHDSIKKKYCIDNGIKLLEISYVDFDKIEEIISNIIK